MTTRDLAVPWTEAKERKGWEKLMAVALTVTALPLLLVAALADGAMLAGAEEHGDGCE